MPTDAEWVLLTDFLTNNGYGYGGSGNDIGKSMAATLGWTSNNSAGTVGNDQTSNNSSRFTALPGGIRNITGRFDSLGNYAFFWSASEDGSGDWYRQLANYYNGVYRLSNDRGYGFSARCLQN